jgi:tape measure domain-containing protein
VAALTALMHKGTLTAIEYENEFQRLAKQYGTMHGPVAPGPALPKPEAETDGGVGALAGGLGQAGVVLAGGALGAAAIGLGQHVSGLIDKFHELQDTWTEAKNTALKFADSVHSTNLIIDEQIHLAHDLHSTETATIELYDTIRDGTDDLNVSHQEQINLTRALGEEVQIAGRSLESAGSIAQRFAYAMARGSISVLELNRMMKQVPELATLWSKSLGTDVPGVLAKVRAGSVSVEDLMRPLLSEGEQIHKNFELRERTIKQKEQEHELNEKLYSQKYDVALGAGHGAQAIVDALKANDAMRQMYAQMGSSGIGGATSDLAREAEKQLAEERKAHIQEAIDDVKNLTGFLRPLGDRYREWIGDTAAVRAEVIKINAPMEAARAELGKLNKAFEIGQIDVLDYTKHWVSLQTTIGHGVGPQAYKITEPIRIAKEELKRFMNEIEAGADVTQAQARKAITGYETTILGRVPEQAKLNNPKLDAKDALADLIKLQKDGVITGEAFRREYESLVTTMNDGRLPEAIKIWNMVHDPIDQASRDFRALEALFRSGRLSAVQYTEQLKIVADTHKNANAAILASSISVLDENVAKGVLRWRDYNAEVAKAVAGFEQIHRTASGIQYQIAAPGPSTSGVPGQTVAQAGAAATSADYGDEYKAQAAQLERARLVANEGAAALVKYEHALKDVEVAQQAYGLSGEEVTARQRKLRDEYEATVESLTKIKSPLATYQLTLKHLDEQLHDSAISQSKYNEAVGKAKQQLLTDTGGDKEFLGAMELQWIKLKDEAEAFGATVANQVVGDIGKLSDALVTAANGGEVSWSGMADAMIQDLERVLLRALAIKAIMAVGDAISPGSGQALGAAIGHAATGFDAVVRGPGSVDSKLFASWVSPGERVTITPPGAYPHAGGGFSTGPMQAPQSRAPINKIYNIMDGSVVRAEIGSRSGNQSVLNVLRANPGAVGNYSGRR